MKTSKLVVILMILCAGQLIAQKSIENINREVAFKTNSPKNLFVARNIHGSIHLEAHDRNTIIIEIKKTISSDSQAGLEKGKQEFKVKIVEQENKIILHPDAPFICFDTAYHGMNVNMGNHGKKQVPYNFELEYTIKVPKDLSIDISTINDGHVTVHNVQADIINVGNINGSIELKNIAGTTDAHTINGTIDVTYAKNPTKKSSYSTINGDINISYLNNLAADVAFESMHGELYTNFTISDYITKATKNNTSKRKGIKYRYKTTPLVRIGKGGPKFTFKTLNGDVSIKKI